LFTVASVLFLVIGTAVFLPAILSGLDHFERLASLELIDFLRTFMKITVAISVSSTLLCLLLVISLELEHAGRNSRWVRIVSTFADYFRPMMMTLMVSAELVGFLLFGLAAVIFFVRYGVLEVCVQADTVLGVCIDFSQFGGSDIPCGPEFIELCNDWKKSIMWAATIGASRSFSSSNTQVGHLSYSLEIFLVSLVLMALSSQIVSFMITNECEVDTLEEVFSEGGEGGMDNLLNAAERVSRLTERTDSCSSQQATMYRARQRMFSPESVSEDEVKAFRASLKFSQRPAVKESAL
jgi:hypothetical protein